VRERQYSGKRFRRSLRHFLLGRSAQALATLGLTLLAIRALDGESYGIYMVIWGFVEILGPLTSLGLLPAVQRYLPELAERGSTSSIRRFVASVTAARISLVLLGGLAFGLGWPAVAAWMGQPDVNDSQGWLGAAIIVAVLLSRFAAETLECLLEQKSAQWTRALLPLLRLAGLATAMALGVVALPLLLLIDLVAALLVMAVGEGLLIRALRRLRPEGSHAVPRRELLLYVWHLSAAQLLEAVSSPGTLRVVVARVLGVEVAGHFAFLQQLVITARRYLPSVLFANLVRPMMIARSGEADRPQVAAGLGLLWKVNAMTVWPLMPAMLLIGALAVQALSGGRVDASTWAMVLLVAGLAAQAQNQPITLAMQVYGLSASIRNMNLLALLAVPAVAIGARWGMAGAFGGLAVAMALRNVAGMAILRRRALPMALDRVGVVRLLAALLLLTAAGWSLSAVGAHWSLGLSVLLGGYLLSFFVVRPLTSTEFALLQRASGRALKGLARFVRKDGLDAHLPLT